MNTTTATKIKFDTEKCGRCHGEGNLRQFAHVDGGQCLKCHGSGKQTSRKGRAARKAYEAALDARLGRSGGDLVVGDVIADRGYTYQVDAIEFTEITEPGNQWIRDFEPYTSVRITTFESNGTATRGMRATWTVRLNDPAVEAEIARDIADRFPGAYL